MAVEIIYLTASRSYAEVRALARAEDELVCVADDGTGERPGGHEAAPRERLWLSPPADLALRLRADVLYCPLSWTEFRCPGVPLVATIVDVLHREFPHTLTPPDNAWRETLFADLLDFSDRFQCISAYTMGQMHLHYGVPNDRMFLTHIAIHGRFRALPPAGAVVGKPSGETRSTPYFFYPANAWVHKNHEALLLAFYAYRQEAARSPGAVAWDLVLTGHEDARMAELRRLADALGLLETGAVRFLGHVDARRLEGLWRGAGALVFPSLHEGFGIPLVEAMEHDVPVLCSTAGSLPEVGGDACLYADARRPTDLAAALSRLAGDAKLRRDLAVRGRQRLRAFRLEQEASAFLGELLAASRQPARPTVKGIWPDGWTGPVAIFGPAGPLAGERVRLRLRLRPMPAPRRVRLFAGDRALGGWDLAADRAHEIETVFVADSRPMLLEVPDAGAVSPVDLRPHGVLVEEFTLAPLRPASGGSTQRTFHLWFTGSGLQTATGTDDAGPDPTRGMKISIVIPSYNQAGYLAATLDSVLGQDHVDREIMVFDGGSTDGSVALLQTYGDRIWWTSGRDHGQTDAINRGLLRASGDVLAYLNSDDVYYRGALAAVAAHFDAHPDSQALYGDAHHLHADGTVMEPYPTEPWDYERLLHTCFLCQPAVFWRREVMERHGIFDERLHYAMDYEYWLRVGRETPFNHLAGTVLAGSRLHGETKTLSQRVPAHREILETIVRYADGRPGPVRRWLLHLAHLHAAEGADADPAAPPAERRRFIRLLVSRALLHAGELGIPLDESTLSQLDEHLKGVGI